MAPRDDRPQIKSSNDSAMPNPLFYSHAVSLDQASRLIFTSGIIAQRADGSFPDSFEEQTKLAYRNLKAVLMRSGATTRDIIKITWFTVGWSQERGQALIDAFLDFITDEYGTTHRPTTTLLPVTELAIPNAKLEIEAIAAVGGHASPYLGMPTSAVHHGIPPVNVDVVVIGGGFSGLQAALDVQKAGFSCVVLEAKHRIGGRSRTQKLQSGPGTVELGATWINRITQPTVYATAQRLGLSTAVQYTDGHEVWQLSCGTVLRTRPGSVSFRS